METIYTPSQDKRAKELFDNFAKEGSLSKANQALVHRFINDYSENYASPLTEAKYYRKFKGLYRISPGADLTDVSTTNLKKIVRDLRNATKKGPNAQAYSPATIETYVKVLKTFYKWYKKNNKLDQAEKDAIEWLFDYTFKYDKNKLRPHVFITENEIIKLIAAMPHVRQKALFSCQWFGACRIGEMLTLRVGDVQVHKHGFILQLRASKSKADPVGILNDGRVNAARWLAMWLQNHPQQHDPEAQLFLNLNNEMLKYRTASKWLKSAKKEAGIKKRIHTHANRKGRATDLANRGLGNAQISKLGRWTVNSSVLQAYINKAGIDSIGALEEIYGLEDSEGEQKQYLECGGCGTNNDSSMDYCSFCHRPIDPFVIAKQEQERQQVEDLLIEKVYKQVLDKAFEMGLKGDKK